jgi:hypothetical protein
MGYIIKEPTGGDLVKFETFVPDASVNLLNVIPFDLGIPVIPNKIFSIVSAFIQYDGRILMNSFFYMWIKQNGFEIATYDTRGGIPALALNPNRVAQFLVNSAIDSTGLKNVGSNQGNAPYTLSTDNILTPRTGNILITVYGYYFNQLPLFP